jgi:hypothetical protein
VPWCTGRQVSFVNNADPGILPMAPCFVQLVAELKDFWANHVFNWYPPSQTLRIGDSEPTSAQRLDFVVCLASLKAMC